MKLWSKYSNALNEDIEIFTKDAGKNHLNHICEPWKADPTSLLMVIHTLLKTVLVDFGTERIDGSNNLTRVEFFQTPAENMFRVHLSRLSEEKYDVKIPSNKGWLRDAGKCGSSWRLYLVGLQTAQNLEEVEQKVMKKLEDATSDAILVEDPDWQPQVYPSDASSDAK